MNLSELNQKKAAVKAANEAVEAANFRVKIAKKDYKQAVLTQSRVSRELSDFVVSGQE